MSTTTTHRVSSDHVAGHSSMIHVRLQSEPSGLSYLSNNQHMIRRTHPHEGRPHHMPLHQYKEYCSKVTDRTGYHGDGRDSARLATCEDWLFASRNYGLTLDFDQGYPRPPELPGVTSGRRLSTRRNPTTRQATTDTHFDIHHLWSFSCTRSHLKF